jgi:magnesium transporter
MIRSIYRTGDGQRHMDVDPGEYAAALKDNEGLLWVDLESEPPEVCEPLLRDTFHFHPLAIDDALQESHIPKVDDWGEYLYLVLHGVVFNRDHDSDPIDTLELDVFLAKNYVVTHHDLPIEAVNHVWGQVQRDERPLTHGADRLLYHLVDELVGAYMPLAEQMDAQIDHLEDEILAAPTSPNLERILTMKRGLQHLRRIIGPQREVLNKLARGDYPEIDPVDRMFYRDVYDHLVRLFDINESMRDLVSDALSTYLSAVNNRMNDIMKTLTIITTLFMPLTFITGFFGMNFFQPVSRTLLNWTSFPIGVLVLAIIILTPLVMYMWIRRRGWM